MASARDDLKELARGFRWGRRPLVPRSAEPFVQERVDDGFPTEWARSAAGVAARQAILKGIMHPLVKNELSLRVHGTDNLTAEPGPLPTGVVQSVGPLEKALAFPGVERIEAWIEPGETIRPSRPTATAAAT